MFKRWICVLDADPAWVSTFWAIQSGRAWVKRIMDRQFSEDSQCSRTGTKCTAHLLVIGEKTEAQEVKLHDKVIWQVWLFTLYPHCELYTTYHRFLVGLEIWDVAGLRLVHTHGHLVGEGTLGDKSSLMVARNPWMHSFPLSPSVTQEQSSVYA